VGGRVAAAAAHIDPGLDLYRRDERFAVLGWDALPW
jgi:hypothetical protein